MPSDALSESRPKATAAETRGTGDERTSALQAATLAADIERVLRRLDLERAARREAEQRLESRTQELQALHDALRRQAAQQDALIRQRTEELRLARDEAVAASAAKTAFLANMSHEIRTPLTAIIGFAEMLLQPQPAASDSRDAVRTIIRNGRHLLDILNDILDVSKIETGQIEIERIPIDLRTLLRDLVTLVAPRAEEKGLDFQVEPQLPLPASFDGDPVRLKQILLNFCSNAIKFTARGSVRLQLGLMDQGDRPPLLRLSVLDTGIGMNDEQVQRLFQPFTQADASTTRRFGGTGLGLYLSQQLATALGARIRVKSRPGQGSAFHLLLPMHPWPQREPLLRHEHELLVRAGDNDFEPTNAAPPQLVGHVLLAEDGEDNQRLVAAYLRSAGLQVSIVGDGAQAVEAALARDFDLVLMDIQMPVMDGAAAVQMLRAAGYERPIVALTANVMKADLQRYRDIGCDDVLAKPVERERFFEVVARQLETQAGATTNFSLMGDEAFEQELAALAAEFRAHLPEQLQQLRQALVREDWAALQALAHTLKGTAGSFGFPRLTELAGQLEAELKAGRLGRAAVQGEGLIFAVHQVLRA